ncbi:MAG: DUF1134 domain-containing protein [Alphaproteobacteria bacterium]|nr:DUF1134 domain-containing protein [Alphaproteobacteria bacterium]
MLVIFSWIAVTTGFVSPAGAQNTSNDTYSEDEILEKAKGFFGHTTAGLAKGIEKVFSDLGKPNGIILGEEAGGAFFVGLRYGKGELNQKKSANRKVFWQGPSVGFDFGGNASKVFTLVYHLKNPTELYRRFPGVDGSLYVIAGISLNYQQAGNVVLAPIRTGVGLRAGANIGYLHYSQEHSWLPF